MPADPFQSEGALALLLDLSPPTKRGHFRSLDPPYPSLSLTPELRTTTEIYITVRITTVQSRADLVHV